MGLLDNLTDHLKNGEMECASNMKVGTFKSRFREAFGLGVRVYIKTSNVPAKDTQTLASTRSDDFKGKSEAVSFKMASTIGEVEDLFKNKMGVKIQIEDTNGDIAGIDDLTIGQVSRGETA